MYCGNGLSSNGWIKNSGGVPANFKNYFVLEFDKPFTYTAAVANGNIDTNKLEANDKHAGALIGFKTRKGEQVNVRVASSFISPEQAEPGCNKLTGVYMAVRSLSPQVVAMDEIGGEDDIKAVKYCIKSGCSVIGTAHGSGIYDTDERLAGLFGKNGFKRAVILEKCGEAGKCLDI